MPIFLSLPYFFYIKSLVLVIQHKKQRWMEPYPCKTSESGMDLPNVLFGFFFISDFHRDPSSSCSKFPFPNVNLQLFHSDKVWKKQTNKHIFNCSKNF